MELTDKQIKDLVERRHPEYLKKKEHWDFLASTYAGGRAWFTDNIFRYFKEGDPFPSLLHLTCWISSRPLLPLKTVPGRSSLVMSRWKSARVRCPFRLSCRPSITSSSKSSEISATSSSKPQLRG
ncbi:hypothetical protein C5975_20380 [Cronobacter sakazakii]|nr:hypothetical protein C5934_21335 [Cronobacter sakazakii]PQX70898.1 hypothetical protein C5975_20380 [Cronobacter sakazakii]PQX86029.1 hypothetical protein C5932_14850 [Cronobacter sakazakii]PQY53718.1 hypothetical protein C5954_20690 [Cronobacter sakazakii]PUV49892.1 hypothetical protein CDT88_20055 [Cronobacter sakazakii]